MTNKMKIFPIILFIFLIQQSFSQNEIVVEQSICNPYNTDPFELLERIVKREIRNDSLIIILDKRESCCATFTANYEIENDTLNIKYENIGDACNCICFYKLTFSIPNIKCDSMQITFNGFRYKQTDMKLSEYQTKIDTLENGNILKSKYENDELIFDVEDQDTTVIYRQYYQGKLQNENKRNK